MSDIYQLVQAIDPSDQRVRLALPIVIMDLKSFITKLLQVQVKKLHRCKGVPYDDLPAPAHGQLASPHPQLPPPWIQVVLDHFRPCQKMEGTTGLFLWRLHVTH